MGYEEVETVLPADFSPRPDPVPEQPKVELKAADDSNDIASAALIETYASDVEPESEAEDAGCNGMRKKKKKSSRSRSSSATRSGRKSILTRWRSSRSKSRGRKSKKDEGSTEGGADGGKKEKKKRSKSKGKLKFRTIRKVDSNGTQVMSNTTKAKEDREKQVEVATEKKDDNEVEAINNATTTALPTVREGSPANTTVTSLSNNSENKAADAAAAAIITAPSPAPSHMSAATELSIEVGDENEQIEIPIDAPLFNNSPPPSPKEEVEKEEQAAVEEQQAMILRAPSRDMSVRSTRSNKSTRSTTSVKSSKSTRSSVSVKSTRSIKSKKSTESVNNQAIVAATSTEMVKSVKSSDSIKSNNKGADIPDDASVRSTRSNKSTSSVKSTKSTKSTASRRSLRSLKLIKSKSKSETSVKEGGEDKKEEEATTAEEATSPKATPTEPETTETEADKEAANETEEQEGGPQDKGSPNKSSKWVKKVSLSIGGYKTSFQFSDPMANLADAVNDALNIEGSLAEQAKELDGINAATMEEEDENAEEGERDYDVDPTRLFMYLQQRAWGLALTQLQKHPEEARVWVYRKSKGGEKAPNVSDADEKEGAVVVQHTALVVHDGTEMPKFRWKLLPLHAAIVLGAPTEIIQDVIRAYPNAARKTDERGSLPVHLAASRLDVDPEGEKVVLQLFGVYADSIEVYDRKGRTPPQLAKLARARKDIEERRRRDKANGVLSQIGQECTESQYGRPTEENEGDEEEVSGNAEGCDDDDDDCSVKSSSSSLSGKFKGMLRRSKSTDTVDRRKKNKKKDKKKAAKTSPELFSAKSLDADDANAGDAVDDASIVESLGPGFAFLKTSKSQEVREKAAPVEEEEDIAEEKRSTEEKQMMATKRAMIAQEYQIPDQAGGDVSNPRNIPLPMSFCDDGSVTSTSSARSSRSNRSTKSSKSSRSLGRKRSSKKEEQLAPAEEEEPAKTVTISEETQTQTIEETNDADGSEEEEEQKGTGGLRVLLEKAVENAGRGGVDVSEFVTILEDEWVTDVEALRRVDGATLDELLPLMLSRELQRLINHADSIDTEFLKEDKANGGSASSRGRSPKKSSKKKKKKRSSHRRSKKRNHYRPVTPPEGPLTPIGEEEEDSACSPASACSEGGLSIVTEARSAYSARSAPPQLPVPDDGEDEEEDEEANDDDEYEEYDGEVFQSASVEDLEIRKLHADLIADARKKFPTREALEDSIRLRQAEVEAAVDSGFDVDKQTLARAALADDEVRKLLPLRLILPTITDLSEMIGVLQMHKEAAMRSLDMENARNIQSEIDELQDQINKEERYVMKKCMVESTCSGCGDSFPTEYKKAGILKTKEKKCEECRDAGSVSSSGSSKVRADVDAVDSRDDDE